MTLSLSPALPVWELLRPMPATVPVTTYGSRRSIRTWMIRYYLVRAGIVSTYVNLDPGALDLPPDPAHVPTVYVDGEWLHAPEIRQLEEALVRHGFVSDAEQGPGEVV